MISKKKKVTKTLKRVANPLLNSDVKTWRVIGYLSLIDGYSDKFKTAVADGLDTAGLNHFLNTIYTLKTNFRQMPHRDDLSLIAETDDYLGNELFWDEHDEFRKDKFKKSTDFQFTLGNVDKVDVENNIIYVRRLKQIKDKND